MQNRKINNNELYPKVQKIVKRNTNVKVDINTIKEIVECQSNFLKDEMSKGTDLIRLRKLGKFTKLNK